MAIATPAVLPDPNWLYSTAAQSAAGIVAIVGGFLVSRVVSLSSEKSGMKRRRDQLVSTLEGYKADLADANDAIDVWVKVRFRDKAIDPLIDAIPAGKVDLEELADRWPLPGATEVNTYLSAEWLLGLVSSALALFIADRQAFQVHFRDVQWLADHGVPVEGSEASALKVAERIVEKRGPDRGLAGLLRASGDIEETRRSRDRQEDRIARRDELAAVIRATEAEIAILDGGIERIGKPEGVTEAIVVLGVFALAGIVFPLAMLALRPVPSGWVVRVMVLVAFAGGLAAVIGFMLKAVLYLKSE